MLAYTAADSLNAITRAYGVGATPPIFDRMRRATQSSTPLLTLRSLYRRVLGRGPSLHIVPS